MLLICKKSEAIVLTPIPPVSLPNRAGHKCGGHPSNIPDPAQSFLWSKIQILKVFNTDRFVYLSQERDNNARHGSGKCIQRRRIRCPKPLWKRSIPKAFLIQMISWWEPRYSFSTFLHIFFRESGLKTPQFKLLSAFGLKNLSVIIIVFPTPRDCGIF